MQEEDGGIVPADRVYRKRVLARVLCAALVTAAAILALLASFRGIASLADTDPARAAEELRRLLAAVSAANALVSVALCVWLGALAYRTYASGRYPPPGTRVVRDTRLRTGRQARAAAAGLVAFGLIVLSTNGVLWYLRRIVSSLQE